MNIQRLLRPVGCLTVAAALSLMALPTASAQGKAPAKQSSTADYVVLVSKATQSKPEWMKVADALVQKRNAKLVVYDASVEKSLSAIKQASPRLMALVAPPEEIDRVLVNSLHRVTRQLDDDPYGDCIWGIVTGYTATDAMRIVNTTAPLTIKRAEATTNVDWSRFSNSMVITDWGPFEVLEQEGYKEPQKEAYPQTDQGMAFKFAEYWQQQKPQLLVSSSHATQYNLEMPFGKGAIISYGNQFHVLNMTQFKQYASFLKGVLFEGKEEELKAFIEEAKPAVMEPNAESKVWVAAGNCLFGDAKKTPNSMVITALSNYGCNQLVGYTVPTWYGTGGWGTLSLFFQNHDDSSLAEAWYLNNQFILSKTSKQYPKLMNVSFNAPDMKSLKDVDPEFLPAMTEANEGVGKDQMGLVHDRDVVAFYGDPAWVAKLDESNQKSPWHIVWKTSGHPADGFIISANKEHKGRFGIWFPSRMGAKKATVIIGETSKPIEEIGLLTNDFLLIDELELPKGGQAQVVFE